MLFSVAFYCIVGLIIVVIKSVLSHDRGVFLHDKSVIIVIVTCSVPDCEFQSADFSEALAIALLTNHGLAHQIPATPPQNTALKGPKLERPKVEIGISTENIFNRRWEVFRAGSGIDDSSAPSQLFQCAGNELGDNLVKANPNATNETLPQLMAAMRSLAVIPVATSVLRTELLQLHQERDEPARAFAAKVRGKAETCAFATKCTCGLSADYTDHAIRDVIVNGLYDNDIRREVLGVKDILQKPVNEVIALVENKEMAQNALPSSSLSAVSSFRRQKGALPSRTGQGGKMPCLSHNFQDLHGGAPWLEHHTSPGVHHLLQRAATKDAPATSTKTALAPAPLTGCPGRRV